MFEHATAELLPLRAYLLRQARFAAVAGAIVALSLGVGTLGYHALGDLPWVDALLNAAMILTGMGPVDRMNSTAGKLFAASYALFSGLAFVTTVGVLCAPVVHRFLHRLHLDLDAPDDEVDPERPSRSSEPPRKLTAPEAGRSADTTPGATSARAGDPSPAGAAPNPRR